jgi:MoxR-like ATPase
LSGLQRERESLLSDLGRLRQENQSLQVQLGKLSIGVAEMQNLRDQRSAWESRERALRACVDELQRDLGELVDKSKAQRVFPSLTAMDDDSEHQALPEYPREKLPALKELAKEIQDRIAGEKLFYGEKDIRAFLAGLATSRLHLLQGISGTGKTSLPLAFAKAIGAASALIEVQSGWRDRNDLLGYYNAFERRFYESEFLQALYRAQLPHHDSLPFFVVLDEMNLSHPEHYFADFLSALEQKPERQRISLLTAKVEGTPRLLEEGRWLRIPQNVWFIGTANHDETTKDFASKTYDRSHVMEFPRHPAAFSPKSYNRPMPITAKALEDAFAKAGHTHRESSARAKGFLNKSLSEKLAKLGLGWGNRLERQIDRFVPVMMESGGTLGEAADHLVATKLLRKLRGRFDLGPKQLGNFQDHLLNAWKEIDGNGFPEKCADLLTVEIKRLGGG